MKKFTEKCSSDDLSGLPVNQQWTKYLENSKSITCCSELLRIAQFVFVLPSHSANVEMQSQRTKKRNQLSVESLKGTLFVQYNFKDTSSKDVHSYFLSNQNCSERCAPKKNMEKRILMLKAYFRFFFVCSVKLKEEGKIFCY